MADSDEQVRAVRAELEDIRAHMEGAWNEATKEPTDMPEIEGGLLSERAVMNLSERERVIRQLGKRSAYLHAIQQLERALDRPESIPRRDDFDDDAE